MLYYFGNQYAWNLFPKKSREKIKAKTNISEDGILMAALNEEDLERVSELAADLQIVRFNCGHGIHMEKPKEFIECLIKLK